MGATSRLNFRLLVFWCNVTALTVFLAAIAIFMLNSTSFKCSKDLSHRMALSGSSDVCMDPMKDAPFPSSPMSFEDYKKWHNYSLLNNHEFWAKMARTFLHWEKPFTSVFGQGGNAFSCKAPGLGQDNASGTSFDLLGIEADSTQSLAKSSPFDNVTWFEDGMLNVCYNVLDIHAAKTPDKVALIWEADEPNTGATLTYGELFEQVCQLSNLISRRFSYLKPGKDVATLYMSMVPQAVIAMLACARLGIIHKYDSPCCFVSVVFAGFSAEALAERILDSNSQLVITTDSGLRGGKRIFTKDTVDKALTLLPPGLVKHVLVAQRNRREPLACTLVAERDLLWDDVVSQEERYSAPRPFNSEHPLFVLYTSGSTGKPKGVLHTSAGYLLYVKLTSKYVFDLRDDDKFGCMADIGWITGHSYVVYGPLSNGVTVMLFESIPTYPTPSRYWQVVEKYKLTQLYTAPTVVRLLKANGDHHVDGHDLSSLRILGSVGEPIHADTWKWFFSVVGKERCTLVDTYWQTETGGIVISAMPGGMPVLPGSASLPFFGIEPALLDNGGNEHGSPNDPLLPSAQSGILCIARPWPGMARTVLNNHPRYISAYLQPYPGYFFTGDGATREPNNGLFILTGRVDDVINVSGHRLSSREIENALMKNSSVAEAGVLGEEDPITGQSLTIIVGLKQYPPSSTIVSDLKDIVRKTIGPIATPKSVIILSEASMRSGGGLPKTRSGKIMRRVLRVILQECRSRYSANEADSRPPSFDKELYDRLGDLSTLNNPELSVPSNPSIIGFLVADVFQFLNKNNF